MVVQRYKSSCLLFAVHTSCFVLSFMKAAAVYPAVRSVRSYRTPLFLALQQNIFFSAHPYDDSRILILIIVALKTIFNFNFVHAAVLSCLDPSYPILSCLFPSNPITSCHVFYYHILSYHVLCQSPQGDLSEDGVSTCRCQHTLHYSSNSALWQVPSTSTAHIPL